MKKIDQFLLRFFLYGTPVAVLFAIYFTIYTLNHLSERGGYLRGLYDFGGLVILSWMSLAVYLCVRLLLSASFREKVLTRLTLIRENDEREVSLTGQAAKSTMLTTIAILIFLFCLSCVQFSIVRLPPEKVEDGKTKAITVGLQFKWLEESKQSKPENAGEEKIVFYDGLPLSSTTVIVGLLTWQFISYNYSMKKLMK